MNALDNSNVGSENVKSHTEREIAIPEDEPGVEAMTSFAVRQQRVTNCMSGLRVGSRDGYYAVDLKG